MMWNGIWEKRMSDEPRQLVIDLSAQRLTLFEQGERVCSYPVSTAANGAGEEP